VADLTSWVMDLLPRVVDLMLEVADLNLKVLDLISGEIRLTLNSGYAITAYLYRLLR